MTAHVAQPFAAGPLGLAGVALPNAAARELRPRPAPHEGFNEPPLAVGSAPSVGLSRRTLNLRWVAASFLTGLAGAALLGSAIYISSEGEITFATPAERAPVSGGRVADGTSIARKGDKLIRAETTASAKQVFRAPMTLKVGDREVIKLRSFTRLVTGLSLTSGTYAASIPPFNPLRFFAENAADRAAIPDVQPETADAEVSVVKSDLAIVPVGPEARSLGDAEIVAQLAEEMKLRAEAGRRSSLVAIPNAMMLSRIMGPRQTPDGVPQGADPFPTGRNTPFRSLEVRVVPENVTSAAKIQAGPPDLAFGERAVPLSRGMSLETVLREAGATSEDIRGIGAAIGPDRATAQDGQQLRILLAPAAWPGGPRQVVRVSLVGERGPEAIAALNDRGAFVSVAAPKPDLAPIRSAPVKAHDEDDSDDDEGTGAPLYDSLYETALKHDISRQTVDELVRIFGYDVDFQRRVAAGDSLELFMVADEEGGAEKAELLSATLKIGSDVKRVFRFQGEDGSVEYFDEAGRSLKKFLLRKPVVEARVSSGFGMRYHPILGYSKMHTGLDWAAKTGTPILAAGNGTVIKAEMSSGYGRRTEIQHANGYVTAYNHQSAFSRGIIPGAKVRQGQIIGYVGSSGLSTGAHLHYEVIVNGHFVDPLKIRVPRGRELDGRVLAEFGRQRDQIEQIRQKAGPNRFAQGEAR